MPSSEGPKLGDAPGWRTVMDHMDCLKILTNSADIAEMQFWESNRRNLWLLDAVKNGFNINKDMNAPE